MVIPKFQTSMPNGCLTLLNISIHLFLKLTEVLKYMEINACQNNMREDRSTFKVVRVKIAFKSATQYRYINIPSQFL